MAVDEGQGGADDEEAHQDAAAKLHEDKKLIGNSSLHTHTHGNTPGERREEEEKEQILRVSLISCLLLATPRHREEVDNAFNSLKMAV